MNLSLMFVIWFCSIFCNTGISGIKRHSSGDTPSALVTSDTPSVLVKLLRLGVENMKLDPLKLPDKSLKVPVLGGIKLHSGSLSGLGSIRSTGPNYVRSDDRGLELHLDMGTGRLAINYTTTISVLFLSVDVYIFVDADSTRITLTINETSDAKLALQSFEVISLQGLDIRLQALKLADPLTNTILQTATTTFKGLIKELAESMMRDMIKQMIKKMNEQL